MLKNLDYVQVNIEFVVGYIIDDSSSLRYKDNKNVIKTNEINIKYRTAINRIK